MNPRKTLATATLFSAMYIGLVSADHMLTQTEPAAKQFVINTGAEQMVGADTSLVNAQLNLSKAEIRQLARTYRNDDSPLAQPIYVNGDQATRRLLVDAIADYLSTANAYRSLQRLCDELTVAERRAYDLQFRCALTLSKRRQTEAAVTAYQALLNDEPNHQAAAINLGLLLHKLDNYVAAEQALKHAVNISSGSRKAKALAALGSNYTALQQFQSAATYYDRSIQYRPGHAPTWLKLAQVRAILNENFDEVSKTFERALALQPDYGRAAHAYGRYQLKHLAFDAASGTLETALEHSNRNEQLHLDLAWAYTEARQFNAAQQQWQWLVQHANEVNTRLLASHFKQVLGNTKQLLPTLPTTTDFMYARAVLADLANDTDTARSLLQQIPTDHQLALRCQHRLQQLNENSRQLGLFASI